MPYLRTTTLVMALAAAGVSAQSVPEFSVVDANGDGVLSHPEFQSALPTLAVTDANMDGMLNQEEAEKALPTLMFKANGFQGGMALVGEEEYHRILSVLRPDKS